jgi:hypothetical protein
MDVRIDELLGSAVTVENFASIDTPRRKLRKEIAEFGGHTVPRLHDKGRSSGTHPFGKTQEEYSELSK